MKRLTLTILLVLPVLFLAWCVDTTTGQKRDWRYREEIGWCTYYKSLIWNNRQDFIRCNTGIVYMK